MHHAPIQPDDDREWQPLRTHRLRVSRPVLADVVRLEARPLPSVGDGAPRPGLTKDRRRPGMY